jgi:hypothetical protein
MIQGSIIMATLRIALPGGFLPITLKGSQSGPTELFKRGIVINTRAEE